MCYRVENSLVHRLLGCSESHNRVRRHDELVYLVAKKLQDKGATVLIEPKIPTAAGLLRKDLIASISNLKLKVVNVQIVSDRHLQV